MMVCEKTKGILEEIDRISGLVEEDLQVANGLEKFALSHGDAPIRILASTLNLYLANLPKCLSELRDLVEGTSAEGGAE